MNGQRILATSDGVSWANVKDVVKETERRYLPDRGDQRAMLG